MFSEYNSYLILKDRSESEGQAKRGRFGRNLSPSARSMPQSQSQQDVSTHYLAIHGGSVNIPGAVLEII